jgi:SAM-dependent methyltransferase
MKNPYPKQFYDSQVANSRRSADAILRLLWKIAQPESVVDVGCGRGAWLDAAAQFGARDLRGLDGEWVEPRDLVNPAIALTHVDLQGEFTLDRTYDLCISMEVAEHLPAAAARTFVRNLCKCSRLVLFSAAVNGQGGRFHLNEQPQSYWAQLFAENDFVCRDIIRPTVWSDPSIEWWYRQNTFLFHHAGYRLDGAVDLPSAPVELMDIIHPDHLLAKRTAYHALQTRPPLRWLAGRVAAYVKSAVTGPA